MASTNLPQGQAVEHPPVWRAIPFVTTSFAQDLWLFLVLWPLWWILGIEQLLLPFFFGWEAIRLVIRQKGRLRVNAPFFWALFLAGWWLVPLPWVEPEMLDVFLKEFSTAVAQVLVLLLFWNGIRSKDEWLLGVRGLTVFAIFLALGAFIFIAGIGRGEFLSIAGRFLPGSLVNASDFFSSIALRTLGERGPVGSLFPQRLSSLALKSSALSMISLLLIPFMLWRLRTMRGAAQLVGVVTVVGLFFSLLLSESRIAYLAFALGFGMWIVLSLDLVSSRNRPLFIALALLAAALIAATAYLLFSEINAAVQSLLMDWRPGSWLTRIRLYTETFRLLPEHPIAGWGTSVRIPGAQNVYAAGTHSSPLAMLFQHGIVGLFLYLGLWFSIWRQTLRGYHNRFHSFAGRSFWVMMVVAFFSLNVREIADVWWWDQNLTIVLWTLWGLVLTAVRLDANRVSNVT